VSTYCWCFILLIFICAEGSGRGDLLLLLVVLGLQPPKAPHWGLRALE